ncbi:MAG: hypothetical protein HQK50_17960 [Oligoflexia bacterium]|nr:hypothetical protein [Oligoflexia bacterium]MBF0367464.1 hypothetical protein [Oligoflexia bacterium]
MKPKEIIAEFDQYLHQRGQQLNAVVIGGAALALLGIITRETQDCDILDPNIPEDIQNSAKEFAQELSKRGCDLKVDWLNNGPASLKDVLPPGWQLRLEKLYFGKSLSLQSLSRSDLLKSKLFAFCDRGQDLQDCIALKPTKEELRDALEWVKMQDANPGWPAHVESQFIKLARKLGHGL